MTGPGQLATPGSAARLIHCVVPDDGTERRLLLALRDDHRITRADSTYCRSISMLQAKKGRRGKLPEPELARLVTVVVEAEAADDLFDVIYEFAGIDRPGGGLLLMAPLALATPLMMPAGVPDEPGEH